MKRTDPGLAYCEQALRCWRDAAVAGDPSPLCPIGTPAPRGLSSLPYPCGMEVRERRRTVAYRCAFCGLVIPVDREVVDYAHIAKARARRAATAHLAAVHGCPGAERALVGSHLRAGHWHRYRRRLPDGSTVLETRWVEAHVCTRRRGGRPAAPAKRDASDAEP
ncbi:MAG TPA: hypothetical protein VNJ51_06495 [Candidatus Dormibacteraeota bacterium]|nr:hypothetical protein [Candidatus Dormibacteraeota bacterium]